MVATKQATRTLPIVFVNIVDPVGAGFVDSLARPGGNATGFTTFEYDISAKWVELLKQIVPGVTRVAVLRDPATSSGIGQLAVIQATARSFGLEVRPVDARDAREIERAVTEFGRSRMASHRDVESIDGGSSRTHRRTRSPPPTARGLRFPLLRH